MKEWEKYKINGDLAKGGAELSTVRHIVHVPSARRIIEDRKIKAGLVYDESRLNRSRVSVTWVSANEWVFGSIYGTVEFQFSWKNLIGGKKVYWVEAMEQYNPTAYRFLLTAHEPRELGYGLAEAYDPTKDDGPLRRSGDQWYWNGNFTSEFMIDEDLLLMEATGLAFVSHNPQFCRIHGPTCADRKRQPTWDETGGRVLAYILAHKHRAIDTHLRPAENPRNPLLDTAFMGLRIALSDGVRFGGALNLAASCEKAVSGALALFSMDQLDSARHLLTLLTSADRFEKALLEIVRQHFSAPTWTAAPF